MTNEEIEDYETDCIFIYSEFDKDGELGIMASGDIIYLNKDEIKDIIRHLEKVLENDK